MLSSACSFFRSTQEEEERLWTHLAMLFETTELDKRRTHDAPAKVESSHDCSWLLANLFQRPVRKRICQNKVSDVGIARNVASLPGLWATSSVGAYVS